MCQGTRLMAEFICGAGVAAVLHNAAHTCRQGLAAARQQHGGGPHGDAVQRQLTRRDAPLCLIGPGKAVPPVRGAKAHIFPLALAVRAAVRQDEVIPRLAQSAGHRRKFPPAGGGIAVDAQQRARRGHGCRHIFRHKGKAVKALHAPEFVRHTVKVGAPLSAQGGAQAHVCRVLPAIRACLLSQNGRVKHFVRAQPQPCRAKPRACRGRCRRQFPCLHATPLPCPARARPRPAFVHNTTHAAYGARL